LIELNVAVLLFGGTSLFAKLIDLPVPYVIFGRSAIAAAALLIFAVVFRVSIRPTSRRDFLVLAGLGVLLATHWMTYFQAIRVSTVAVGIISLHTYPVITVLVEPIVDKTRLKAADAALGAAVLIGIIILVPAFSLENALSRGVLWGIGSAFVFTFRNLVVRRYVQRYSGTTLMMYQTAVSALVLLPVVAFGGGLSATASRWPGLLLLGTIFTALSQSLYASSLKSLSAKTVSIVATLLPLYSAILAAIVLGEIPSVRTIIGGSVVIGAVMLETVRAASAKAHGERSEEADRTAADAAEQPEEQVEE
jgi:drug/metabolite transporter (DMT)-like permease